MIIRHLPYFAVAAEEQNLQLAATRLGITQPALSRRMRDLENELGVLLFDRSHGRLALTTAGKILAEESRRLVDEVERVTQTLRKQSSNGAARLAIGLNERTIASASISSSLRAFRTDNPAIELAVSIMPSTRQAEALREGILDIGILNIAGENDPFEMRPLLDVDPMVIVLPEDHPLASLHAIAIRDLAGEELIWPSSDAIPTVHRQLSETWAAEGVKPRVTTEVHSAEAALHAVSAGLGIAVIRQSFAVHAPAGACIRTVARLSDMHFPVYVAWLKRMDSMPRRRFLSMLANRNLIAL